MKWLIVATMAGLLAGCAAARKDPPPLPFTGTHWQALLELPPPGEQPWVRFGDGRMEGFGGCNRIEARVTQDAVGAKAIAIGRIELSHTLCDASAVATERRMLEILQAVSSYAITVDLMTMSGSGGSLKFRAVSAEGRR